LLQALADASSYGSLLAASLRDGRDLSPEEMRKAADAFKGAALPHGAAELPVSQTLSRLIMAPHHP
jgi:hypothetical protein